MLVIVNLTQYNKQGNASFEASKKVNIGNAELSTVSIEIGEFIKDLQTLIAKNSKLGYNPLLS